MAVTFCPPLRAFRSGAAGAMESGVTRCSSCVLVAFFRRRRKAAGVFRREMGKPDLRGAYLPLALACLPSRSFPRRRSLVWPVCSSLKICQTVTALLCRSPDDGRTLPNDCPAKKRSNAAFRPLRSPPPGLRQDERLIKADFRPMSSSLRRRTSEASPATRLPPPDPRPFVLHPLR